MKCKKCGCSLPEDSEFCQYCGAHLEPPLASEAITTPSETSPVELVSDEVSEAAPTDSLPEAVQEESLVSRAILHDEYFDAPQAPQEPVPAAETVAPATASIVEKNEVPNSDEKHNFCKKCGSAIDPNTKRCSGCGKQYFNAKKTFPVVLSVLLIASIGLNVAQYLQGQKVIETVATQATQIEKLEKEVSSQKSTISSQMSTISAQKRQIAALEEKARPKTGISPQMRERLDQAAKKARGETVGTDTRSTAISKQQVRDRIARSLEQGTGRTLSPSELPARTNAELGRRTIE